MKALQENGIWIIDAEARTLFANTAMAQILGTDAASMSGELSFAYIFPEDIGAAEQLFASKQRGDAAPFHFRLRRKDGSAIWADVQGTPMHDADNGFLGVVGTFRVSTVQSPE